MSEQQPTITQERHFLENNQVNWLTEGFNGQFFVAQYAHLGSSSPRPEYGTDIAFAGLSDSDNAVPVFLKLLTVEDNAHVQRVHTILNQAQATFRFPQLLAIASLDGPVLSDMQDHIRMSISEFVPRLLPISDMLIDSEPLFELVLERVFTIADELLDTRLVQLDDPLLQNYGIDGTWQNWIFDIETIAEIQEPTVGNLDAIIAHHLLSTLRIGGLQLDRNKASQAAYRFLLARYSERADQIWELVIDRANRLFNELNRLGFYYAG